MVRGGPAAVAAVSPARLGRAQACAGAGTRPWVRGSPAAAAGPTLGIQNCPGLPAGSGTLPWWSPSLATEYRPPGHRHCAPAPAPPLGGATSPRPAVKPQRSPKSPRL
jgi:hypothetical protein